MDSPMTGAAPPPARFTTCSNSPPRTARLPFQTWVEVTNLSNGKQVDVRINDRGPFVKGRIVDLSQAAARDIDMLRAGTARVRLKVIAPPLHATQPLPPSAPPVDSTPAPLIPSNCFAVQAGAFADRDRAESLRASLEVRFPTARLVFATTGPILWRVIVGPEMTRDQAAELAIRVRQRNRRRPRGARTRASLPESSIAQAA